MTIDFAAMPDCNASPLARALSRAAFAPAANDNHIGQNGALPSDMMLQASLKHFAEHGLGAARDARARAEAAFFAGDRETYDWWLGITRTLDRRLAAQAVSMGFTFECSPARPGNSA